MRKPGSAVSLHLCWVVAMRLVVVSSDLPSIAKGIVSERVQVVR